MAQKELLTSSWYSPKGIFSLFGFALLVSLFLAIGTNQYFLVGIPVALMIAFIGIVDFRKIFLLLFACIPISTDDIILPSGFSTDLPTEPLMIVLMGVFFFFSYCKEKKLGGGRKRMNKKEQNERMNVRERELCGYLDRSIKLDRNRQGRKRK